MGRKTLTAGEMLRMVHAENIQRGYMNRQKEDAAKWVSENPELSELLRKAQMIIEAEDAR